MTRLFIRFKSFYVFISFLFVVFLFFPLKTFGANIQSHSIIINASQSNTVISGDRRTINSSIVNDATQTLNTSVAPTGFYCVNSSCYSKVFNTANPLTTISHTVYWQSNPTTGIKASKTFYAGSSDFLQLEITSDVQIHPNATLAKVLKTNFFKDGIKTLIGDPIDTIPANYIWNFPKYSFIVRSVLPPSISTFTASPPAVGSNGSYQLISGNSFTLTWEVANATATTQCALTENDVNSKTFEGIGAGTYNFSLNTSNVGSFRYDVSNLTASTIYKVSCSHNGLGTTLQRQIKIAVVPAPSVTKFLVKNADGVTLANGLQAGAEAIVDAASHLEQLRRQPLRLFHLFKGFAGIRQAVAKPVEFLAHLVVILARQPNILNRMLKRFVIFDFAQNQVEFADDKLEHPNFAREQIQHVRLDGVVHGKIENRHVFLLAEPVQPADALLNHHRIPGQVEIDQLVAELQVHALAAGLRGNHHPRRLLEIPHGLAPLRQI